MARRLAQPPRFPAAHARGEDANVHAPRVANVAVLFGVLGAAVYLFTVLFAIGDGGLSATSDHMAARITLGVAGALAAIGFVLALVGLGKRGQRSAAFVAFVLGGAFVAFVVLSLLRG